MKLKQLLKNISEVTVKGSKEIEISGITSNSKYVSPGNLFIAKKGSKLHGGNFIQQAFNIGAAAVLTDMYDPLLKQFVQVIHPDVNRIEALLASTYYNRPSDDLWMVGVTGTNGKTTTTYAIRHVLEVCKISCGLIGSIEYIAGRNRYKASLTTPDTCMNQKLLREMSNQGCKACVMEVSSHAMEQGRVDYIDYDVAVFTNFSHEHLDYHGTMENYFQAKAKLLRGLKSGSVALINGDDSWADRFIEASKAPILTYGIEKKADIQAKDIELMTTGSRFVVSYQGREQRFEWPLVGRFNVYNALACIATVLNKGVEIEAIAAALASFHTVPGRLDPVKNALGVSIFVDHAHKPEALKTVLKTLRELSTGKIITVFGCGGDRDRQKRPLMASISETFSDVSIVTSDNPRSEDPQAIASEIVSGFSKPEQHMIELDRKKAICKAIDGAKKGDIILIAGKGHETEQIFASRTIDFDDRRVAKEYCDTLTGAL